MRSIDTANQSNTADDTAVFPSIKGVITYSQDSIELKKIIDIERLNLKDNQ